MLLAKINKQRWIIFAGDLLLCLVATKFGQWIRLGRYWDIFDAETGASLVSISIYLFVMYVFDMENVRRFTPFPRLVKRMTAAMGIASLLVVLLFYAVPFWQYGRGVLTVQLSFVYVLCLIWRIVVGIVLNRQVYKDNLFVVGAGERARDLSRLLEKSELYNIVGYLVDPCEGHDSHCGLSPILGPPSQLLQIARKHGVHSAIWALPQSQSPQLMREIMHARINGVEIIDSSAVYEELTGAIPVEHLGEDWFAFASGFNLISNKQLQKLKRFVDYWMSGLLLLVLSPLMVFIALAIRIDSPGPVFYCQRRVGRNGMIFEIIKFRSMQDNVEKGEAVWATKDDVRITRVGKWLRLMRLDEIPQLFNVLRNDMSIIGPRPERPEFTKMLEEKVPHYAIRHYARPGITGWAQVSFTYGASVEDALRKLEFDLYYIKNMSMLLDLKILLKTIGVVLSGQGAR